MFSCPVRIVTRLCYQPNGCPPQQQSHSTNDKDIPAIVLFVDDYELPDTLELSTMWEETEKRKKRAKKETKREKMN